MHRTDSNDHGLTTGESIERALDLAGAPAELVAWVAEVGADDAWDGSDKGDWLLWLAACEGVALDDVVQAAHLAVHRAVTMMQSKQADALRAALQSLEGGEQPPSATIETVRKRAEAAPASYRSQPEAGYVAAARAVVHLATTVEAIEAAIARDEGLRNTEAIAAASIIGVPPVMMTRPQGALRLVPTAIANNQVQQELAFAVASAARAVEHVACAIARDRDGPELEEAEGEVSDMIHETLDPARDEIRLR